MTAAPRLEGWMAIAAALGVTEEQARRLSERIEGMKAIAGELGVSETQVRRLANPRRPWPLPLRYGVRGPYVLRGMLELWRVNFDAPHGAHRALRSAPDRRAR